MIKYEYFFKKNTHLGPKRRQTRRMGPFSLFDVGDGGPRRRRRRRRRVGVGLSRVCRCRCRMVVDV